MKRVGFWKENKGFFGLVSSWFAGIGRDWKRSLGLLSSSKNSISDLGGYVSVCNVFYIALLYFSPFTLFTAVVSARFSFLLLSFFSGFRDQEKQINDSKIYKHVLFR